MMAGKARFRMVLTMVWGHVPTTAKHEVTYERRPPTTGPVTEVSPFVMWKNAGAVLFGCLALPRAHCEPRPLRSTIRPSRLISASEACNEWSLALGTEHGPAFVVLNTILSRTLSDNYNPEVRVPLMSGSYQTRRWRTSRAGLPSCHGSAAPDRREPWRSSGRGRA